MAKKTIGQFIAALRKANGMTQQDIADRLNVSNKAVSRWERDECAPDISLIPALAELLGVTCDELLKGERILETDTAEKNERKEPKVDRQVKALISRTLSSFKTLVWIALAISVVGLILMFGISYGFYRPIIGFAVMLLFEAVSLVLTILAVTKAKDVKRDNEVFEMADETQTAHFNNVIGNLSFWSLFVILASVIASIPFVLFNDDYYVDSVLTMRSYITVCLGFIVLLLALIYLTCRKPYVVWITEGKLPIKLLTELAIKRSRMNFIQIGLTVLAGILFVIAPWFSTRGDDGIDLPLTIVVIAGLVSLVASIVYFIIFIIKQNEKRNFILSGVRNLFLVPAAFIVSKMHSVGWSYEGQIDIETNAWMDMSPNAWTKHDSWSMEYFWFAVLYCLAVFVVFALIKVCINAKDKRNIG